MKSRSLDGSSTRDIASGSDFKARDTACQKRLEKSCNKITSHGFLLICDMPGHFTTVHSFVASEGMLTVWSVWRCTSGQRVSSAIQSGNDASGRPDKLGCVTFAIRFLSWAHKYKDHFPTSTLQYAAFQKQTRRQSFGIKPKGSEEADVLQSHFQLSLTALNYEKTIVPKIT